MARPSARRHLRQMRGPCLNESLIQMLMWVRICFGIKEMKIACGSQRQPGVTDRTSDAATAVHARVRRRGGKAASGMQRPRGRSRQIGAGCGRLAARLDWSAPRRPRKPLSC